MSREEQCVQGINNANHKAQAASAKMLKHLFIEIFWLVPTLIEIFWLLPDRAWSA